MVHSFIVIYCFPSIRDICVYVCVFLIFSFINFSLPRIFFFLRASFFICLIKFAVVVLHYSVLFPQNFCFRSAFIYFFIFNLTFSLSFAVCSCLPASRPLPLFFLKLFLLCSHIWLYLGGKLKFHSRDEMGKYDQFTQCPFGADIMRSSFGFGDSRTI